MKVGVLEAKNRLSELIERVEQGEDVVITRRGTDVAKLVPARPVIDVAAARAAMARIAEIRDSLPGPPVTVAEIIAWKNEGRR